MEAVTESNLSLRPSARLPAVRHGWAFPVDGRQWRAEQVILGALGSVSLDAAAGTLPCFGRAGGYPVTVG